MRRAWGMVSILALLWGGQASWAQRLRAQISGRQAEGGERQRHRRAAVGDETATLKAAITGVAALG